MEAPFSHLKLVRAVFVIYHHVHSVCLMLSLSHYIFNLKKQIEYHFPQ